MYIYGLVFIHAIVVIVNINARVAMPMTDVNDQCYHDSNVPTKFSNGK
jgi:hypothetical protein